MSCFLVSFIGIVIMSLIGKNFLFMYDQRFRNNTKYKIFIVCCGFISLILLVSLGYNIIVFIIKVVMVIRGVF